MKNNTIAVAELETRHFSFRAYGRTEKEVMSVLRKTWFTHARETGAWGTWKEMKEEAHLTTVAIGSGYRDWFEIVSTKEKKGTNARRNRYTAAPIGRGTPVPGAAESRQQQHRGVR